MKILAAQAEVSADGILRLEVPCDLAPGRFDIVISIEPDFPGQCPSRIDWNGLSGLGREVWQGIDATDYLNDLRADRDPGA